MRRELLIVERNGFRFVAGFGPLVLGLWYWSEGTISVNTVSTPKVEAFYWAAITAPDLRAGRHSELAGEMPDSTRGAIDQHLAPEQQTALAQRVQCGEARDRQRRRLGIVDRIGQRGDRRGAAIDPFGPGARRQNANHACAGFGARCHRPLRSQPRRQNPSPAATPARPAARRGASHRG